MVLGGSTLMQEESQVGEEPTCPGDRPRVSCLALALASERPVRAVCFPSQRAGEAERENHRPPKPGQAPEEQGGTVRDVFILRGNGFEGEFAGSRLLQQNLPRLWGEPLQLALTLAVALEGTLDWAPP